MRGIFCIETACWMPAGGHRRARRAQPSVGPILQLIAAIQGTPCVHRRFATGEQLQRLLRVATSPRYRRFPVIYVACHGEQHRLSLRRPGAGGGRERSIALPELAAPLAGRGAGKLLVFSACRFMKGSGAALRGFVRETGVEALMGYERDVGWLESAQLELGLLAALTRDDGPPDGRGLAASLRTLPSARDLMRHLDFRVVPRRR